MDALGSFTGFSFPSLSKDLFFAQALAAAGIPPP
jgi:hypothetical protein